MAIAIKFRSITHKPSTSITISNTASNQRLFAAAGSSKSTNIKIKLRLPKTNEAHGKSNGTAKKEHASIDASAVYHHGELNNNGKRSRSNSTIGLEAERACKSSKIDVPESTTPKRIRFKLSERRRIFLKLTPTKFKANEDTRAASSESTQYTSANNLAIKSSTPVNESSQHQEENRDSGSIANAVVDSATLIKMYPDLAKRRQAALAQHRQLESAIAALKTNCRFLDARGLYLIREALRQLGSQPEDGDRKQKRNEEEEGKENGEKKLQKKKATILLTAAEVEDVREKWRVEDEVTGIVAFRNGAPMAGVRLERNTVKVEEKVQIALEKENEWKRDVLERIKQVEMMENDEDFDFEAEPTKGENENDDENVEELGQGKSKKGHGPEKMVVASAVPAWIACAFRAEKDQRCQED